MEQAYSKDLLGTVNRSTVMADVHPTQKSLPLDGTQENACTSMQLALALLLSCVPALKKMLTEPGYLIKNCAIR